MSLLQLPYLLTGDVGLYPSFKSMVSSDSLSTITTAGYLNNFNLGANPVGSGDVIYTLYSATKNAGGSYSGTYGIFTVSVSNGVISLTTWANAGNVLLPVVSGNIAVFNGTTGQIKDAGYSPTDATKTKIVMASGATTIGHLASFADITGTVQDSGIVAANVILNSVAAGQTIAASTSSATPASPIRAIQGSMTESAAVMSSGNVVGVRGVVNCVGASGGFIYGTQGKIIATGTLSGSNWAPAIFGQLDVSAATINGGQVAALWGDWGTTGAIATDMTGTSGIKFTNTTANKLNEQINTYGDATFYLNIRGNPGPLSYYLAAGTSAGSAGDAAHCAAQQVLKIVVQGATVYIPIFTQNS